MVLERQAGDRAGRGVRHYAEADGTYVPYGWCLLAVATGEDGRPLAWQRCDRENAAAYLGLFGWMVRPDALVTDGGAGCVAAWMAALNAWHSKHGGFIAERTMAEDAPDDPRAKRGRSWWYAHRRLRRACFRFVLLNHEGSLFAFCDPELAESGRVASTTNQLEDGVNAEIKRVPDAHRGLGEEHMRRRCEWVVYMRSANPDPEAFAAPDCRRPWRPGPATPRTTANPRRARGPMCSVPRPASTPTRTGSASERDGTDGHDAPDTPG